ncbi:hypothetical protein Tco_0486322, partial [Tanacetum coccineum]
SIVARSIEASSIDARSIEASSIVARSIKASSIVARSIEASSIDARSIEASSIVARSILVEITRSNFASMLLDSLLLSDLAICTNNLNELQALNLGKKKNFE